MRENMRTWTRAELKEWAKETLHRYYWRIVLVSFIMAAAGGAVGGGSSRVSSMIPDSSSNTPQNSQDFSQAISGFQNSASATGVTAGLLTVILVVMLIAIITSVGLSLFVVNPLVVGCRHFFTEILTEDAQLREMTVGFNKGNYLNVVKNMFLMGLFTSLWSLLLIIPGIIKAYEYRMIPYLLTDHPEWSTRELFDASKEMMSGNKWDTFVLDLSFLGWGILGVITCGIATLFWVAPYQNLTNAALYRRLSGRDRQSSYSNGGYAGGYSAVGYGQPDSYGQGTSNSQTNTYDQGNSYSQNSSYSQGNSYTQTSADGQGGWTSANSSQGTANDQSNSTPYGQDYYSGNDSNNDLQ